MSRNAEFHVSLLETLVSEIKPSQRVQLYSKLIMQYPVELRDTHMVLRLAFASIQNVQTTWHVSIPVLKYRPERLGYHIAFQPYSKRLTLRSHSTPPLISPIGYRG